MKTRLVLGSIALALLGLTSTASAGPVIYYTFLNGAKEAPANASPGVGRATIIIDSTAHTLQVDVTFSGLLAGVTASHIHAATATAGGGTAPVATQTPTFTGFPSGVTSGTYSHTFNTLDTATYRAGYITSNGGTAASAESALFAAIAAGKAYLNIHTTAVPSGEIRGFLAPVPEPATLISMAIGGVVLTGFARNKARRKQV